MILDNNGTKVYAEKAYTKQELEEIYKRKEADRIAAESKVDSLAKEFNDANEALTAATSALEWAAKALAEFPPEEIETVA